MWRLGGHIRLTVLRVTDQTLYTGLTAYQGLGKSVLCIASQLLLFPRTTHTNTPGENRSPCRTDIYSVSGYIPLSSRGCALVYGRKLNLSTGQPRKIGRRPE